MCVGNEWIFQSIVDVLMKSPSIQNDGYIVDSSVNESVKVEFYAFSPRKI